jgi:paraquat-inducible protein B
MNMSEPQATVSSRRRLPVIWLVPIVALVLGLWMVAYAYMTEGPEIVLVFPTAEGIEAGKTKVKSRSVQIGIVESVALNEDLESVTVVAKLDRVATPLLRDDTRFWVVRARFGAGGITGVGTIMSGGYIEVEPGTGEPSGRREFVGLPDVPVTAVGTPGLRLVLTSSQAGGVGVGDPLLYHGYRVGQVESTEFDAEAQQVRHHAFIDAPYDTLVDGSTRFWNASGISLEAGASGMKLHVGSFQTLLAGGIAFGIPEGRRPAGPVANGASFELFDSYADTREENYRHYVDYVVSFAQSVGGLEPGAPVEYRGLRVGTVRRIMVAEAMASSGDGSGAPIPILIRLEPARVTGMDSEQALAVFEQSIVNGVTHGLRGTLQSGNLLTGSLKVAFDFYPEEKPAQIGSFAHYPTLPTLPGGLQRIERRVADLLAKLNDLPLDRTVAELNRTLVEVRAAVANDELKELPATLNQSLTRLDRTLDSVEDLSRTVGDQPNSLIFSKPIQLDPEPKVTP